METVQINERKSSNKAGIMDGSSYLLTLTNLLLHSSLGILLEHTYFLMFCSMILRARKEILCF